MADVKAASPKTAQASQTNLFRTLFPVLIVVLCYLISRYVFYNVFGDPANFDGYDAKIHNTPEAIAKFLEKAHPHGILGTLFKGGFIIPIGMTLFFTMLVFTVERAFTIGRAWGIPLGVMLVTVALIVVGLYAMVGLGGVLGLLIPIVVLAGVFFLMRGYSMDAFVGSIREYLKKGDIDGAIRESDAKQNSVGNVTKSALMKFKEMEANTHLDKEEKKELIKSELEKSMMLELPGLDRNLTILATVASLGTLVGLIGTVMGMIRSFSALGAGGAPNAAELSVGISEALTNTAMGITTSAVAIFLYNFFTTKIDSMTYKMEEIGYSIVQAFDSKK